jgi:tetratricopeptide (TPR) repeat protein
VAADFGFSQGFDSWSEDFKESPIPGAGAQRAANEVVSDALGWLQAPGRGPFFAWLHVYDPHAPYAPPEPYRTEFAGRLYDGEIAFTDAELGRVFDWLRSSGHEADTVVAVVADHGESLGEHREVTHAVLLYEATLHVPFLIAGPGVPAGRTVEERVATVDVVPTLLKLLGVMAAPETNGRDLGPAMRGERLRPEPLYAESLYGRLNFRWSSLRSLTTGDWKLVQGSRSEIFHLTEDPAETRDLSAAEAPRVERMRADLQAALAKLAPGGDTARAAAVTPDSEAMLRSLGYVGGSGGGARSTSPGCPIPATACSSTSACSDLASPGRPLRRCGKGDRGDRAARPGQPFVYTTLARLAYRTGHLSEAARAYHRALELDPERPEVRQNYGKLLRDMDRLEDSEKELRLALVQTDAQDARTRSSLAETLARLGRTDEALGLVAEALRIKPGNSDALAAQGLVLAAQGRLDEAAKSLEAAGASPDARIELARVELRRGDLGRAREFSTACSSRTPAIPGRSPCSGSFACSKAAARRGSPCCGAPRRRARGARKPGSALAEGSRRRRMPRPPRAAAGSASAARHVIQRRKRGSCGKRPRPRAAHSLAAARRRCRRRSSQPSSRRRRRLAACWSRAPRARCGPRRRVPASGTASPDRRVRSGTREWRRSRPGTRARLPARGPAAPGNRPSARAAPAPPSPSAAGWLPRPAGSPRALPRSGRRAEPRRRA